MPDLPMGFAAPVFMAIGAASGWGLAALVAMPELRERLGVRDVVRLRQAHLDVLIMGGLLTAAGSVPGVPAWARRAAVVGACNTTNPPVPLHAV